MVRRLFREARAVSGTAALLLGPLLSGTKRALLHLVLEVRVVLEVVHVLVLRRPFELRVDLAAERVRAERSPKKKDVALGPVDHEVLPAPRHLDAGVAPLLLAHERGPRQRLGELLG